MSGQIATELVMAVGERDEELVRHVRRVERGFNTGFAWRRNRAGRKPFVLVRVVWRVDFEIFVVHTRDVFPERVLDGGICLQQHPVANAIEVDGGNYRPL